MNHLEVLRREAELLVMSAIGQPPHKGVPACPGLNLGETVRHIGGGYRGALAWIRLGREPEIGEWPDFPEPGEDSLEFMRSGADAVIAELEAHDEDEPCATWWPDQQNYGFWRRRLAHETTMHRMDVQGAAGMEVGAVDDEVAIDGVDEVLTLWLGHKLDVLGVRGSRDSLVTIQVEDHLWLTRCGPRGASAWRVIDPEDTHVADAQVSADPMTMYRWLWGRLPDRMVEVVGDHDAIAQLWALLRLATK
ncbi:maleylpyruvate isomerase N-terminal domain-containing protein [Lentzea albidocapillata]|uniref:MDMPI C-terminal domain-containing protein n=1 Tax=Lentzea albidocapillata TaxID=40571 RepID=A0A1W2EY77_9PSEU|nr:maleylpyruvate isomerase N-terminal domain-containing protein [Lentzea albidocapillata]SMD14655.1 MDMPI C-terminal domain-containing protein [Lentzea albidocapillata]